MQFLVAAIAADFLKYSFNELLIMSRLYFTLAIIVLSFVFTYVLRRYALATSMIDVPNERSSHTLPTPRGGGVAIVIVFMLLLSYFFLVQGPQWSNNCPCWFLG
jgi:UDP-N-acetylmuramyl pentapeptide phosphotransferase/UDP-N-acetylglucosamine-1-phosphate transferase